MSPTSDFCIFELVLVPNFSLNWQFWFFGPNFPKKGVSRLTQKSEHHDWILHTRISLSTKFQFTLTVLIFFTKFAQNRHFRSKTEKLHLCVHPWSLLTILNICPRGPNFSPSSRRDNDNQSFLPCEKL